MHRGRRRDLVAALEAVHRLGRERGWKARLDPTRLGRHLDREAALPEHLEHAVVRGQHLGLEDLDACVLRDLRQVGQQDRPEAVALELVGYRERDLGPAVPGAKVRSVPDQHGLLTPRRDEPVPVAVVDVDRKGRGGIEVGRRREETKAPCVLG
ncbi:MAG TPA: hypothetical protein VE401_00740 [Solirubrobacterales bacterium]|nr:hypothetical protein [Solirubrobacterales bacterium]